MSQNGSFFNNYQNNFTFQNAPRMPRFYFPVPPPPPPQTQPISDAEIIRNLEGNMPSPKPKFKVNMTSISRVKKDLGRLAMALFKMKAQEKELMANMNASDEDWLAIMDGVNTNKDVIQQSIAKIAESWLDMADKVVAKREAKRLRLRKQRQALKAERKERLKQREETSRKIDENLKKIEDDIQKAKQEEEAKFQADMVLKEVRRKKHDAKRSIVKLDALVKLRKARENTSKGKGVALSESETNTFYENIEKLKSLWLHKLATYEQEEAELCSKLEQRNVTNVDEQAGAIAKWRKALFGGEVDPQVDFNGDFERFIAVRAQWDRYIADGPDSTPIPVGWVFPDVNRNSA